MEAMPSSSLEMADLAPRRWSGQRAGAAAPGGGARPRAACSRAARGGGEACSAQRRRQAAGRLLPALPEEGGGCSARRQRQAVGRLLPTHEQEKGGRGSSIPAALADAVERLHNSENAISARVAAIMVSKLRDLRTLVLWHNAPCARTGTASRRRRSSSWPRAWQRAAGGGTGHRRNAVAGGGVGWVEMGKKKGKVTGERRREPAWRVNASMAGQTHSTSARNHLKRAQVPKLHGIRSWGVCYSRFHSWGLKLDFAKS